MCLLLEPALARKRTKTRHCRECCERRTKHPSGLCKGCRAGRILCLHGCGRLAHEQAGIGGHGKRGLCKTCYATPAIKRLYPPRRRTSEVGLPSRRRQLPVEPTEAMPGTDAKIQILEERAARDEYLFHPQDGRDQRERPPDAPPRLTGAALVEWFLDPQSVPEEDW